MFENIADKIKMIAKINLALGWVSSIVLGFLLINSGFQIEGFMLIVLGFLGSWMVSIFLYAIGHLIDNTDKLVESGRQIACNGQPTAVTQTKETVSQSKKDEEKEPTKPYEKVIVTGAFNPDMPIRNIKLHLFRDGYVYLDFILTKELDIRAIRAQLSVTTIFSEEVNLGVLDFADLECVTPSEYKTEKMYCTGAIGLVSKAKTAIVHISQYMLEDSVVVVESPDQSYKPGQTAGFVSVVR